MTLNDLEGYLPTANFFKWYFYTADQISTDTASRGPSVLFYVD